MTRAKLRRTITRSLRSLRVRITLVLLLILSLPAMFLVCGCGATIRPPADPESPVRVYLIDYGRHTGLVLPREQPQTYVEYHYGEWAWYAKDRTGPFGAVRALVFPTRGTLGRREHAAPINEATFSARFTFDSFHTLTVNADEAHALRERLDDRYEDAIETEIHHARYGMDFVHDERNYTFWSNCNPVLAGWLRELGCEVRGPALLADWKIEPD